MSTRKKRRHRRGRRKTGNWFTRLSIGKRIGVCFGGVIFCLAASGVIYVAAKLGKIDTEEIPTEDIIVNKEAETTGEGYTNVALFGIDSREGELEVGTRSDCIIVASLNNKTKEVRMVSVYRDTLLDIGNKELQKCNAAYSFGGPTAAINMLNRNLDLDIQDFATVDFAAVSNAIDLLGGLEIEVKEEEMKALNHYVYETANVADKTAREVLEPGVQLLNGVQATTYARIRSTAGGDFTRTERQRIVIEKMVEKIQQSDLATINKMIDTLLPTIKTSFSTPEILSYAKDFAKYKIGESSGFPFDKTTDTISGLGSIVIPVTLEDNVRQLHEFLYGEMDYTPSSEVSSISTAVVNKVGEKKATDEETLSSQTYSDTEDDRSQESGRKPSSNHSNNQGTSGGNTSTGSDHNTGNSGGSNSGTSGSGSGGTGNSGGESSGGSSDGSSGGESSGGSSGGESGGGTESGGGETEVPQ